MRDLIRLSILALAGYVLFTTFMEREVEVPEELEESGTPSRCIQRLEQAGDRVEDAIRRFGSSPVDVEAWVTVHGSLEQRLSVAAAACICSTDACLRGRKALGQLRSLVTALDDEHRLSKRPLSDASKRLETFRRTWEEAKALNR